MEWLVWSHLAESQKLLLPSQPITNRVKTIRQTILKSTEVDQ